VAATLRLACVLAHPDDETLGMGGTLARYASEGIEVHVITATRGQAGRYRDNSANPGPEALGRIREAELRVITATRGPAGRYRDNSAHPGPEALAEPSRCLHQDDMIRVIPPDDVKFAGERRQDPSRVRIV